MEFVDHFLLGSAFWIVSNTRETFASNRRFHWLTRLPCTPNWLANSLIVLSPRIADSATRDLNDASYRFRVRFLPVA